ncbi:MAG: regulatory iron-sulfur-containing complex subunit RicT [Gemmatimonadota bacterium]|nr:regulatory iron-sulfur-containing complex subunit RicT [Gemmatimonadota bacterium]MDE3006273.1 regulatory iron-sulfur-containing complex subunit RicT [Gemmatimonadota bacterium]MDE3014022.1 regulatory iron-sulfur-containing complex subunit RicT [Gemmatimonadota bacterium]
MAGFAEIRFKGTRKEYFTYRGIDLRPGQHVIVEADRGEDLGEVSAVGVIAERKCSSSNGGCATPAPDHSVVRLASEDELDRRAVLRNDEHRVRSETKRLVGKHGLKMKVTEAEWQFDRNKLIIYFTAEKRVDFRQLVRDLARTFRARIELRQIGVRDEAALLGGIGRCGRELCCSTWLPELKPVSLQLAKDQKLSLNPAQISGCCGRLMCCLMYEHKTYVEARRRFPREGRTIKTSLGEERVVEVDIWHDLVTLRSTEGERRTVPLADLKQEVGSPVGRRREKDGSRS